MKIREILTEDTNYESIFAPIEGMIGLDLEDAISKIKKEISQGRPGYQNWIMYTLKVVRTKLIGDILQNRGKVDVSDIPEKQLQKLKQLQRKFDIRNINLMNSSWPRDIVEFFKHMSSFDYPPIKKYDPGNKKWEVVKSELGKLEEEYQDKIGDDARLLTLEDGDEIIKDFGNGFAWVMLSRGACREEANAMGHCGNVPSERRGDRILSLRKIRTKGKDTFYEPFLTFIFNERTGLLGEQKGRANDKPEKKYHPYIIWLYKQDFIKGYQGGGYEPENNFALTDLTQSEQKELYDAKPILQIHDGLDLRKINEDTKKALADRDIEGYDPKSNRMVINMDIETIYDENMFDFEETNFYFAPDPSFVENLPEECLGKMYKWYRDIIDSLGYDYFDKDEFIRQASRGGMEYIIADYEEEEQDEIESNNDYEEGIRNLAMMSIMIQERNAERNYYNFLKNNPPESFARNWYFAKFINRKGEEVPFYGDDKNLLIRFESPFLIIDDDKYEEAYEELREEEISLNDIDFYRWEITKEDYIDLFDENWEFDDE